MQINWALYTEKAVGRNHPTLPDVVNRSLRDVLSASGVDPDADFPGFTTPSAAQTLVNASVATEASARSTADDAVATTAATDATTKANAAQAAAISAAATDATTKANAAETNAKAYSDVRDATLQVSINAVDAKFGDAANLTGGSIAAARVPEAAVTQHEAALAIAPAQLTGFAADGGYLRDNGLGFQRVQGLASSDLTGTIAVDRLTGTYDISISGNAATTTNGVVTTGIYADPAWLTALAGSKVTGNIAGNAATATLAADASKLGGQLPAFYTNAENLIGFLADARVPASAVTQHEAALTLAIAQTTGLQTALDGKAASTHDLITSHPQAGLTAGHVLRATAASAYAWGQLQHTDVGGLLDGAGKLRSVLLPAIAITDTDVFTSEASMLAWAAAETGDVAIRTDLNKSFILRGTNPAVLGDWQELLTPTDTVTSVNGYQGAVTLGYADVGAAAAGHTHAYADLTGIPATFAPSAHFHAPNELTGFGADGGYLRSNGSGWARVSGLAAADLTGTIASARLVGAYTGITDVGTLTALDVAGGASVGGRVTIVGDANGALSIGGDYYNHVLVAVGLNNHPLQETHQVGVYSALKANSFASGAGSFNAAFESAIGTQAGAFTLEAAANFTVGSLTKGAGSTITRSWGLATYEESAATHNATIAPLDAAFSGNWFIYYPYARPSTIGGAVTLTGTLALGDAFSGAASGFLRLSGGAAASDGAWIMLSGSTHATVPGRLYLSAGGTGSVVLRAGNKEYVFDSGGTLTGNSLTLSDTFALSTSVAYTTTPGTIQRTTNSGLALTGVTGATYDMALVAPNGAGIMTVPTGTVNAVFAGALTAAGTGAFGGGVAIGGGSLADTLNLRSATSIGVFNPALRLTPSTPGASYWQVGHSSFNHLAFKSSALADSSFIIDGDTGVALCNHGLTMATGTTLAAQAITGNSLTLTGGVTTTATDAVFVAQGVSTSRRYAYIANSSGALLVGVEGATGGEFMAEAAPYQSVIRYGAAGVAFGIDSGGIIATLNGAGLAVNASEVFSGGSASYVRIAGGGTYGTGATVLMFGPTHAAAPGRLNFEAVGTGAIIMRTGGADRLTVSANGGVNLAALPTSSSGLAAGDLWNDAGVVKIV